MAFLIAARKAWKPRQLIGRRPPTTVAPSRPVRCSRSFPNTGGADVVARAQVVRRGAGGGAGPRGIGDRLAGLRDRLGPLRDRRARVPDGRPQPTVTAVLGRERRGDQPLQINVSPWANLTFGPADVTHPVPAGRVSCSAVLLDGSKELPLEPKDGWKEVRDYRIADVVLPELADGDYRIRVTAKGPLGPASVEIPFPLYAPARVHVITDRPLYEPGNLVHFRAVVLRAKDLAPLDNRPGRWVIREPSGESVLEERSPAGRWGVASGSFPLDAEAPTGTWHVRWESGEASDDVAFEVAPFTLPRFRVEARPSKPFYGMGERPVVRGNVTYSSGAPVANAPVSIDWIERRLASAHQLDRREAAREGEDRSLRCIHACAAGDPARPRRHSHAPGPALGGRRRGGSRRRGGGGPVGPRADRGAGGHRARRRSREGFNNRLFLRIADSAGGVLPGVKLKITRAWEATDPGIEATADEDGVAALQLDPGPAVNVLLPPMPVRKQPPAPPVELGQTHESPQRFRSRAWPTSAALDAMLTSLSPCRRFAHDDAEAVVGIQIDPSGVVLAVGAGSGALPKCVGQVVRGRQFAAGRARLLKAEFSFRDSDLPQVTAQVTGVPEAPPGLQEALQELADDARPCLTVRFSDYLSKALLTWRTQQGSKSVAIAVVNKPAEDGEALVPAGTCLESRLRPLQLDVAATGDYTGVAFFNAEPAESEDEDGADEPETMLGYEFVVKAWSGERALGSAKLRLRPGQVPPLRLRATPVLAQPGSELTVELLRGPGFRGELPKKLTCLTERGTLEAKVDPKKRAAVFKLPEDARGWLQVDWTDARAADWSVARAVAYVTPKETLEVAVRAEKEHYAPGSTARLLLETKAGGKPTSAAVGLFGVDESLSQLVPLAGPDAMSRLRPAAPMRRSAFGILDAQALALGRIRGANAAAATVLGVGGLPPSLDMNERILREATSPFDPTLALTEHFYGVLAELHRQVRTWEKSAPAEETMSPPRMSELWSKAVEACAKRGEASVDAYGRPLRLKYLPSDLLALVDPRAVVLQGTRLPEDVEDWSGWVMKEQP